MPDAFTPDADPTDGGGDDAALADAGDVDLGPSDAGAEDGGGVSCDYVGVDEVIVVCSGDYTFVNHFISTLGAPSCPPFYGFAVGGPRFDGFASAIASNTDCDPTCQYHFATSVTRLYCGRRTGFETLAATGCPDVYRFAEGYYPSVEAHDLANPCP